MVLDSQIKQWIEGFEGIGNDELILFLSLIFIVVILLGKFLFSKRFRVNKSGGSRVGAYQQLLSYLWPEKSAFLISILGFLVYSSTTPLFAKIIQVIIDALQSSSREDLVYLPLWFSGLIIVRGVAGFIGNYFLARVGNNIIHSLRCQIFNQYSILPTAYFDENNSGYLMSRITHNVGQVTAAATDAIRTFVREGLTVIGLLAYLFYVNWVLSLVFLLITPLIAVVVIYVSKRMRKLSKRIQDSIGDMTHIVSELVNGHRIVKSFGGGRYERNRFLDSSLYNRNQSLKFAVTHSLHNPIMQFIMAIALSIVIYLALEIMAAASAGEFVSYLTAAFILPRPIRTLVDANSQAQKGIAAVEPLFDILSQSPEKNKGKFKQDKWQGRLEFKNVSFAYGDGEGILSNINFVVEPGQTIALVGKSGSGKSTLLHIAGALEAADAGRVWVSGKELTQLNDGERAQLRRTDIALIFQQFNLIPSLTVAANIAFQSALSGTPDLVHIKHIVSALGLEEQMQKYPEALSGGQQQRVAIARAIAAKPKLLLADEPTGNLDEITAQSVLDQMLKLVAQTGTALMIVTHSTNIAARMNRQLHLCNGFLV